MSKFYKKVIFSIICVVILLNIFVSCNNVIEGIDDIKDNEKDNKSDETDFCMKAALLAQKNESTLDRLTTKINDLFDKKMKDLKSTCENTAKAIMKKHPPGYNH